MRQQTALKVFIAFPGDVRDLRERVEAAVEELDETWKRRDIRLDCWAWDTDAVPGFRPQGPQELVDPHIEDCDMLVGIFRTRLGAALPNGESGTEHEVRKAIAAGHVKLAPRVMLYFQEPTPEPATEEEKTQLQALARFRDEVRTQELYGRYSDAESLEKKLRQHLQTLLFEKFDVQSKGRSEPLPLAWSATAEPALVRSEGVAEQMGQIGVAFTGGVPRSGNGTTLILDVEVRVTQNLTNRMDARGLTDAQLLVFGEGGGTPLHAVAGRLVSDDSILFERVPLDPPGADDRRHMRISNVRANVQAAGDFGTVFGGVDVRPVNREELQILSVNEVVAVADSRPGVTSNISSPAREPRAPTFSRAHGVNLSLISGKVTNERTSFIRHLVFREGFAGAFKTPQQEARWSDVRASATISTAVGCADCGTRFLARFTNFPVGVRLFVSQLNVPGTGHRLRAEAARLVAADDRGITSNRYRVPEPSPVLVEGMPVVALPTGISWVVWELTETGPLACDRPEEIRFGIAVAAEPNGAQLGTGHVACALAPLTTVYDASPTAPVPRFVARAVNDVSLFTVLP